MRTALYIFEDSEAVIKQMNKKQKSHNASHLTHTCVNTAQQLADILTEGSFTRDRWKQLTILVNIMTQTTFTQSKLSFSSVVVNPLISSMNQRAPESFVASASAKQKLVHRNDFGVIEPQEFRHGLSRSTSTRLQSWRRPRA